MALATRVGSTQKPYMALLFWGSELWENDPSRSDSGKKYRRQIFVGNGKALRMDLVMDHFGMMTQSIQHIELLFS